MRHACLAILLLTTVGCVTVKPESLLGQDEAVVVKALGSPKSRQAMMMPSSNPQVMGALPNGLFAGEPYVVMFYSPVFHEDEWFIFIASTAAFERVYGRKPQADAPFCVIDVQKYPKGAILD